MVGSCELEGLNMDHILSKLNRYQDYDVIESL